MYHITNVLDAGEQFDVRLRFHSGSPDSMVEFAGEYQFPMRESVGAEHLAFAFDGARLHTPVPLPAKWLSLKLANTKTIDVASLLPQETLNEPMAMAAGNRCFVDSVRVVGELESATLQLYSQ
ncbi:MAG: hypothetical protein ACI9W2_004170, partial [Gammaproteobacteria bacterium]